MQGNTTAPAADAVWLSVAAARGPPAARGAGLPVTGVQPRHVTTRRGQAGVPSPSNNLAIAHIVTSTKSCVTH